MFCFLVKVVFTYPIINFPFRTTLHYLLHGETPTSNKQLAAETIIPFVFCCFIACIVTNVATVFSFVGAVARTSVFFIFPAGAALASSRIERLTARERISCWLLVALGFLSMGLGVLSAVLKVLPEHH